MAGGLVALLDDIAALARAAAASLDDVGIAAMKASSKAAGVVIDDAAVTPQYVAGLRPSRELPVIWRIARGSLFNKLVIILPIALLLSTFLPWLLQPLLMLGGAYLCYEGAEKVWEKFAGRSVEKEAPVVTPEAAKSEKVLTAGAIRTDLILSAEIMVIALNEVADESFWSLLIIMIVVAIGITIAVYGAVALLVKIDDIGVHLVQKGGRFRERFGNSLVAAMPRVLDAISIIGTVAMLWVGGHLILVGMTALGFTMPYDAVHWLSSPAGAVPAVGGFLVWLIETVCSLILGFIIGSILVGIAHVLPWGKSHPEKPIVSADAAGIASVTDANERSPDDKSDR